MSEHKVGWFKQFRDPRTTNVLLNFELHTQPFEI
jgi:hypothetical protein